MSNQKGEVVTFKVDANLYEAMKHVSNRSEFIRSAILAALEGGCPLCMGTGILTPKQKEHWEALKRTHEIAECDDCHEAVLVCRHDQNGVEPSAN